MDWFDLLFPLSMILFPAVFSIFVRHHPDSSVDATQARDRMAALRRRLWLWTAAAATAFLAVHLLWSARVAYFMWPLAFPLWFAGAMPLLQAKDRGWQPIHRPATARSATLRRRDVESAGLRALRSAGWVAWVVLLAAAAWPFLAGRAPWSTAWVLFFPLAGAFWLFMGPWAARMSAVEPEPLDGAGSAELADEYARFRRFKIGGWYGLSVAAMLVASAPAVVLAWAGTDGLIAAIWVGAGGGGAVGLLGAVFGIRADLHRARLHRLYHDLSESRAP